MSGREAPSVDTGNPPQANRDFDLTDYLDLRDHNPTFVMVEFGYGDYPVAFAQPGGFTGQRAYIGIEAWLRHPSGPVEFDMTKVKDQDRYQNIIYLYQGLGKPGESNRQTVGRHPANPDKRIFIGPYDPTTVLPDGAADEFVLSNVIGDGHIAHSLQRSRKLMAEASRLTDPNGVMVIRETMTPLKARQRLTANMLQRVGLQVVAEHVPGDAMWDRLEGLYSSSDRHQPTSFYQFLTKTAARRTAS